MPRTARHTPITLHIVGHYGDGERLHRELRPFVANGRPLVVNLDGAEQLGDEDARVLRRVAELVPLRLVTGRPGVGRWLRRHELGGEEA